MGPKVREYICANVLPDRLNNTAIVFIDIACATIVQNTCVVKYIYVTLRQYCWNCVPFTAAVAVDYK
jgi:hypothetical protein